MADDEQVRSRVVVLLTGALALLLSVLLLAPATSSGSPRQGRFVIGAADDTTTPFNLVSLPALAAHEYDGHGLRLVQLMDRDRQAERWRIRYTGDGLPLAGTLLLPRRPGVHPVVVALHGYAPPPRYRTGRGLLREEWRLAALGFVVLHPDYRNYGDSWIQPRREARDVGRNPRAPLGYPADVLNAVVALRDAHVPDVDTRRMALLGRSMGGGIALQVAEARPRWFRALVLSSPVSARAVDDYHRWVSADAALRRRVVAAYGSPTSRPDFWRQASASSYLYRLRGLPVQVHHGTADPMCPVAWSETTVAAMRSEGVDAHLFEYAGQVHRLDRAWPLFMHRTDVFLDHALR